MQISESAESFAKEKYANTKRKDGILHLEHLKGVVTRLKSLGITDNEVLAAAWLHTMIDDSMAHFDEIDRRFGSKISVLVLSISKDTSLTKDQIDKQYVKQLKESPIEAKLIKLCDVSTSLKDLKNSILSKTKRTKQVKKEMHYLGMVKQEMSKAKLQYPGIQNIIDGINEISSSYGRKPIVI
ncbi:MAG TPA: HD domain-containing protein [Candidatus Nitrosotalea sp.]|nr:HD domain-containing protein [Candidatus Nitrosotalea sp.]